VAHVTLIQFISREGHLPFNQAEREDAGYKSIRRCCIMS